MALMLRQFFRLQLRQIAILLRGRAVESVLEVEGLPVVPVEPGRFGR